MNWIPWHVAIGCVSKLLHTKSIRQEHANSGADEVALSFSLTWADLSVTIGIHGNEWRKEFVNVHGGVNPKTDVLDMPTDA